MISHSLPLSLFHALLPFIVEQFPEVIAVAFGYANSFSESTARSFTIDQLFQLDFGPALSSNLLTKIQGKFPGDFDVFTDVDQSTGLPMNPTTKEVFDPQDYIPEIQVALDLSSSVAFASSNFKSSDILDSLYSKQVPTISDMVSFVKKKSVQGVISALNGLFNAKLETPAGGLSIDAPTLDGSGLVLGDFSDTSTRNFPPRVDLDTIQGFNFDISVSIEGGPAVSICMLMNPVMFQRKCAHMLLFFVDRSSLKLSLVWMWLMLIRSTLYKK